jgi:hypothetical protein
MFVLKKCYLIHAYIYVFRKYLMIREYFLFDEMYEINYEKHLILPIFLFDHTKLCIYKYH